VGDALQLSKLPPAIARVNPLKVAAGSGKTQRTVPTTYALERIEGAKDTPE
jgi:hypothetical protein